MAESDPFIGEYLILYCLVKSSMDSTGVSNRETVRNAAKLAVYDAMMINPNSHQVAKISFWKNIILYNCVKLLQKNSCALIKLFIPQSSIANENTIVLYVLYCKVVSSKYGFVSVF